MKIKGIIILSLLIILLASMVVFGTNVPLGPYFDDTYFDLSDDALILKVIPHEKGGLEADVSAYDGLIKISGGSTSAVTDNSGNWNTAYGWGNHSTESYLKVITGESIGDLNDIDLTDLADNKILKYNSNTSKFECEDESGSGATTFLELTDTPAAYDNGKYAKSTAEGVVWDTPGGGGTVTTSGTPEVNDIARFTGVTTIEGLSYVEFKAALDLEIGTDVQAYDAALANISGLTYISPSFIKLTADDTYAVRTLAETKTDLSLNNVENTALSTWAGTTNITTLGTISTGVWSGTALLIDKLPISTVADADITNIPNCNNVFDFCETTKNYALYSELHPAVTIGTGNGLSLSTQVLSLALASTNTTGALSDTNWNTFNNKEPALTDEASLYSTLSDVTGFMQDGEGYTNLTSFVDQTAWRLFYSNADGDIVELALGTNGKYLECNGVDAAPTWTVPAGAGDALTTDPLSQFAATTSAELAGVISDETGSGVLVYGTSPTIASPTITGELGGELDAGAHSIGFTQQTVTYNETTTTVVWTNSNKATVTLTGNVGTFAFTNPTNPCNVLLKIVQDATGSRVVTAWDVDIMWVGGTKPTLTTTGNGIDICSFYWDGTNYFGVASLAFATP